MSVTFLSKNEIARGFAASQGIPFADALKLVGVWLEKMAREETEDATYARARLREKFMNPGKLDKFIAALKDLGESDETIDEAINAIWGDKGIPHAAG